MVRCAENIVNNDVFVSFHFFVFFVKWMILNKFFDFFGVHLGHFETQNSDFGRFGTMLKNYRFLKVSLNGPRLRGPTWWKVKMSLQPLQLPVTNPRLPILN